MEGGDDLSLDFICGAENLVFVRERSFTKRVRRGIVSCGAGEAAGPWGTDCVGGGGGGFEGGDGEGEGFGCGGIVRWHCGC